MSVLGEKYEYDVFFSYAWAASTGEDNLRDWTRAVASATMSLLKLRFTGAGQQLNFYLDRDEHSSGKDLDAVLKASTERSAIFVAFVSPYYASPYCQKEVEWFCDGVGATGDALAERMCVLRVQTTPDDQWPARLKGSMGKPLLYKDLADESGQPRGIANFIVEGKLAGIADVIQEVALEIADKITTLSHRLKAQAEYSASQELPDKPLFFFEAEATDGTRWAECGKTLRNVPSIVLPAGTPKAATDICPDEDLAGCYGLVMLRHRKDDQFGKRIKSAYLHRQKLFREKQEQVRWALLDDCEEAPPEEEVYDIPRVRLEGDWVSTLQKAFRC